MSNVKICGLSRPEDIAAVNEAKADYAGFVFFEKSKRNISLETAAALLAQLDPRIKSVAVCVSPDVALFDQLEALQFNIIQIHKTILPEILEKTKTPLWQAVNISAGIEEAELLSHPSIVGYVIDGAEYGAGKTFGWEQDVQNAHKTAAVLRSAMGKKHFILAGGLNADNVAAGIRLLQPDMVDVSSGVEKDNRKDKNLIFQFIHTVRAMKFNEVEQ